MASNLDIWNKLGRTNPEHTKKFTRGGGFKGTAIKPIYTDQKMTEVFGACGDGWGYTEPTFQLVPGSDGQTAVYCWLSIWYRKLDGNKSEPVHGVGGDFAIKKFSSGLQTDDEAFKKAFTDALGNAMKHLGMSADVHMGLFDDNKYVAELKREFAEQPEVEQEPGPLIEAATRFILDCERAIDAETSRKTLLEWWNGDRRKDDFRKFVITEQEGKALNARVQARAKALADNSQVAA